MIVKSYNILPRRDRVDIILFYRIATTGVTFESKSGTPRTVSER